MSDLNRGRAMPAEWSPHDATWLSWPHNRETWPHVLRAAEAAMAEMALALAPHEHVYINVVDEQHAEHVTHILGARAAGANISLELIRTDDAWIRDYGAIVVRDSGVEGGRVAIDFEYNAWGGKYPPFDCDRAVARQMADRLDLPRVSCGMVLEGGSIDVNGADLGLVTEQCLLNPNRNPDLGRAGIEANLKSLLGLRQLVWLGCGIEGDDTDGHIDNLARFVAERRVLAVLSSDESDPNYSALNDNWQRLEAFRDDDGQRLEVIALPLPEPVLQNGQALPASFANFYIANGVVLLPAYGGQSDREAQKILGQCFPDREIVPIDCRSLVVGLGALHCLTQQIPGMVPGAGAGE